MNQIKLILIFTIFILSLLVAGCEVVNESNANRTPAPATPANANPNTNPTQPTPNSPTNSAKVTMFTLPMLQAFLSNESFTADLKKRLQLTDEQIQSLQKLVSEPRKQTNDEYNTSSYEARENAEGKVKAAIGEEKTRQLASLIEEYWYGKAANSAANPSTPSSPEKSTTNNSVNAIPSGTRIVVNTPGYRMDVFQDGKLLQSYKVGIGYPEFPLPEGLRQAKEIIFNPSWVPPDEPWVESSNKVKPGEKIEAGAKLNPLGIAKIPIGLPSLIHGGKNPSKIGGFASHGCVGLTDAQLKDFIQILAKVSGTEVTAKDIAEYGKNRKETKNVKLASPVPVELRYETLVVEDGKLHIYRDVYDMNTNNEDNLRAVLGKYGVKLENLSEAERSQVMDALKEMSRDANGKLDDNQGGKASSSKEKSKQKSESAKVTRTVKGAKERVVEIAALQGKGYPEPVALNSGGAKESTPIATTRRRR